MEVVKSSYTYSSLLRVNQFWFIPFIEQIEGEPNDPRFSDLLESLIWFLDSFSQFSIAMTCTKDRNASHTIRHHIFVLCDGVFNFWKNDLNL